MFNNVKAVVQSASKGISLTVVVPLGAGTGPVTVSTNLVAAASGPVFTYQLSPVVYAAGIDGLRPVYWQNGGENYLSRSTPGSGQVRAMAITNSNDYFSSEMHFVGDFGNGAAYWMNGTLNNLPYKSTIAQGNSIAISGTDIYIGGMDYPGPAYWKNGIEYLLPGTTNNNVNVLAMAVSGPDIYAAAIDGLSGNSAVYWKNGTKYNLPLQTTNYGGGPRCIAISGTDVYFGGYDWNTPVYWLNGIEYTLPQKNGGGVYGMVISGTDVYFCGNDGGNAVFWKNGVENILPSANGAGATAYAITLSGTDVYLAGQDNNTAVYWDNKTEHFLSSNPATASSIIVPNQ
jgi:hypothetical protein